MESSNAARSDAPPLVTVNDAALRDWIEALVARHVESLLSQHYTTLRHWAVRIHGRSYDRALKLAVAGLIEGAVQEGGPGTTWLVPLTAPWPGTKRSRAKQQPCG